mmetsp:Transcript_65082/g.181976  ORF Transcript_65082/g.181976 Transcript_65082/m.181976 type:complete len:180 (-) Transcript_65082:171-710(-)
MKLQRRPRVHFEALLLVVLLVALNADAFMASTKSIGWGQYYQSVSPRQSILRPLQAVAKSGGKMIVTEEMYTQTVLSKDVKRPVLVFFSAPWCGPCRLTNPVVKEVMKQYAGEIDVVEVCTDDLAEVAEQAGIVSIPTIQFYYGGQNLETIVGCVAKSVLANAVDKVLEDIEQLQPKSP